MPREDEGKASGANNTIRELGGVFGVAVLAAIFAGNGSYATPQTYVDGLIPAVFAGAAAVALGAALALALPPAAARLRRSEHVARQTPVEVELAA